LNGGASPEPWNPPRVMSEGWSADGTEEGREHSEPAV
jgi:hypothetical protein